MSAIDELMRSPLDDERPSGRGMSRGWLVAAVVFVVGFVAAWTATSNGEQAEGPSTATTASGVALAPYPPGSVVVADGLAARIETAFTGQDGTWFVVSLAAARGADLEQIDGFIGGIWTLEFDGWTAPYVAEYFNPFYPGVFSVLFPTTEIPAEVSLKVLPYTESTRITKTRSAAFVGLPWSGQPIASIIEIDSGTDLVIDTIVVNEDGVSVQWRLEGDDEALASFSLSGEVLQDGRAVGLLRHDLAGDEHPWGFATTPSPPGHVSNPLRQPASQSSGELTVPFSSGTELDPETEYTVKVTLTGSIAHTGTDEITIPLDLAGADLQSEPPPAVTTTLPSTDEPPQAASPPAGSNGAMAATGREHELVLFGGLDSNSLSGATWLYDTDGGSWMDVSDNDGPPARADHAMVYVPTIDKVVLFGGTAGFGGCDDNASCHDRMLDDTWTWDPATRTWEQLSIGGAPQARRGATMVYDPAGDRVVLFGGEGAVSDTENGYLADTWILDPTTQQWAIATTEQSPPARARYGMIYDPRGDRILVFGGEGPSQDGDDQVWSLETGATQWVSLDTTTGPGPRWGFTLGYDPESHTAILIGGAGIELTPIAGGTTASVTFFTDTWRYDPQFNTWTELLPVGEGGTWIRRAAAVDPTSGVLVTFGGQACDGTQTAPGAYATSRTYRLDLSTFEWW